jgi:hypothetical protein
VSAEDWKGATVSWQRRRGELDLESEIGAVGAVALLRRS